MTEVWLAIIGAVVTIFGTTATVLLGYMALRQRVAEQNAKVAVEQARLAAIQAARVRRTLKETNKATSVKLDKADEQLEEANVKLDDLTTVTNETHKLVNSKMGETLQANLILSQKIFDLVKAKNAPEEEIKVAEGARDLAQRLLDEHDEIQKSVDAVGERAEDRAEERAVEREEKEANKKDKPV